MKNEHAGMSSEQIPDPHRSKVSPDDPRLQLPKARSRTLRKGPVAAIALSLVGIIAMALSIALEPKKRADGVEGVGADREAAGEPAIPDLIRLAPDDLLSPLPARGAEGAGPAPSLPAGGTAAAIPSHPYANRNSMPDPAEQERLAAIGSAIFFGGGSRSPSGSYAPVGGQGASGRDAMVGGRSASSGEDQNNQARKNEFFRDGGGREGSAYLKASLETPRSPYEVKAGTVIPASLVTGINSDLPGNIVAMVREHVYDTVSGEYLLIPQGTRLLGIYDSMVSYGQERVQVAWVRMIRPDGSSIMLEHMPGVDLAGYSGYKDKVNNHIWRLISGALLSSVLSVGATLSQGSYAYESMDPKQNMAANVGQDINNAGQQITKKNLNIQPTIEIREGMAVNVLVNKDMVLAPYGGQ